LPRIDALTVGWYANPREVSTETHAVDAFLIVLNEHLPEALPVYFDAPGGRARRRRFAWLDRASLYDVAKVEGTVQWTATDPFILGHIFGLGWKPERRGTPVVEASLTLNMQALDTPEFEGKLLEAFPLAAAALGAFYAVAQANYGVLQEGGGIFADRQSRVAGNRVTDGMGWLGLPRRGVSFEWLGSRYVSAVGETVVRCGTLASGGLLLRYRDAAERASTLPHELLVGRSPRGRPTPAQILPHSFQSPP
jgi:hypothetical protein